MTCGKVINYHGHGTIKYNVCEIQEHSQNRFGDWMIFLLKHSIIYVRVTV